MITPTQKLKLYDYPILEDNNLVFTSGEEIEEFKHYIKELTNSPELAYKKAQKILLIYIEAIQYIISCSNIKLGKELTICCSELVKTLYSLHRDANILLYCRKVEYLWKSYIKLCDLMEKVPNKVTRVSVNQEKISGDLQKLSKQIRAFY